MRGDVHGANERRPSFHFDVFMAAWAKHLTSDLEQTGERYSLLYFSIVCVYLIVCIIDTHTMVVKTGCLLCSISTGGLSLFYIRRKFPIGYPYDHQK